MYTTKCLGMIDWLGREGLKCLLQVVRLVHWGLKFTTICEVITNTSKGPYAFLERKSWTISLWGFHVHNQKNKNPRTIVWLGRKGRPSYYKLWCETLVQLVLSNQVNGRSCNNRLLEMHIVFSSKVQNKKLWINPLEDICVWVCEVWYLCELNMRKGTKYLIVPCGSNGSRFWSLVLDRWIWTLVLIGASMNEKPLRPPLSGGVLYPRHINLFSL